MERNYRAFISYRHLQPDERVAEQVQDLLEKYRAPRGASKQTRIGTIFRDRTELPTSGDLNESLRNALAKSEYLIVILSERTKESKWCMEEIRAFKEAHGGRIDHILPVLVSGEPANAIPSELCSEVIMVDGCPIERVVEPLCCDVRADSWRQQHRKLKTEYLRLAAPMLGCGFDDLYQRDQRRKKKRRAAILSFAFVLMLFILLVIGVSYVRVTASEKRYHDSLMSNYVDQAARLSVSDDGEAALAYYTRVLALDPSNRLARVGSLIELQKQGWFYADDTNQSRDITPNRDMNTDRPDGMAADSGVPDSLKAFGKMTQVPDETQQGYVFMGDDRIRIWMPEDGNVYELDRLPASFMSSYDDNGESIPIVMPMFSGDIRRFVQSDDYDIIICEPAGEPGKDGVIPCKEIHRFPYEEWGEGDFDFIYDTKPAYASPETGLLLLNEGGIIYAFDIFHPDFLGVNVLNKWVGDIRFRSDGKGLAVINSQITGGQAEHRVTLFDRYLFAQQNSTEETGFPIQNIEYRKDDLGLLWATRGNLRILDGSSTAQTVATLPCVAVKRAEFSESSGVEVLLTDDTKKHYSIARFIGHLDPAAHQEKAIPRTTPFIAIASEQHTRQDEEYYSVTTSIRWAELRDESGAILDSCFKDRIEDFYAQNEEFDYDSFWDIAPDGQTAYSWGSNYLWGSDHGPIVDYFYRVRVDATGRSLAPPEKITFPDLYRSNVEAIEAFDGGCAVTISGGKVLFYRDDGNEPFQVIALEHGIEQVDATAVSEGELFAALTSYAVPEETPESSIEVPHYYVIELWDIETGTHITNLEARTPEHTSIIEDLSFIGDTWLCYKKRSEFLGEEPIDISIRIKADVPNATAVAALDSLTCYQLGDNNTISYKTPQLPNDLGNWQPILESVPFFSN